MIAGFQQQMIDVDGVKIATWTAGQGPPLVLLHGMPQTHHCWYRVAPAKIKDYSVVLCDLRGYGASDKPNTDDESLYSKRVMARDIVSVMTALRISAGCEGGE